MKNSVLQFYNSLFPGNRLFISLAGCIVLYLFSFFQPRMALLPELGTGMLVLLLLGDLFLLYGKAGPLTAVRLLPDRLSNGDLNEIRLTLESRYGFEIRAGIIDEIPFQFQQRNLWISCRVGPGGLQQLSYTLRPVERGAYLFGMLRVYVRSPLGLVARRMNFGEEKEIAVYPSFLQLRRFELMAAANRLSEAGLKKIRQAGNSSEFDQVRNYVNGDDYRTLNWKATARKGEMMVNSYVAEKSRQVHCIIDKSRAMKMPFDGLSLLDYAINASLALSGIILQKQDKAGLITIAAQTDTLVAADRKPGQLGKLMEALYREKTRYLEMNGEALHLSIRKGVRQRSLLIFFTNFESMHALQRQLPYLKSIARNHLLLLILFENTGLKTIRETPAATVSDIYLKTIAAKFDYEKKLMVRELSRHGIRALLTTPEQLTVNAINAYLNLRHTAL